MNNIQRMVVIMLQFVLVYLIILVPYPHAFQRLVRDKYGCNAEYFNSFRDMMYRSVIGSDFHKTIAISLGTH